MSACLRQGVDHALVLPASRTDRAWSLLGVLLTVERLPRAGMPTWTAQAQRRACLTVHLRRGRLCPLARCRSRHLEDLTYLDLARSAVLSRVDSGERLERNALSPSDGLGH